jgi:hypothetical protein
MLETGSSFCAALLLGLASAAGAGEMTLPVPSGMLPPMIPAENPLTKTNGSRRRRRSRWPTC